MNTPTYLLSTGFLTLFVNNVSKQINARDARYAKAVQFIKEKKWDDLITLMDQPAALAKYSEGLIRVFDNEVHYNGAPITGVAVQKVLDFVREGLPIEPLVRFLNNLYQNTDEGVRANLYTFLERNNLAITERGSFLVFKLVKGDGGSPYHSGEIQDENGNWIPAKYEVGKTYLYDKSRIVKGGGECSSEGIYVGNKTYWGHEFNDKDEYTGSQKMLIAEVYPQDVANAPYADGSKLVVCKLKIVDEYKSIKNKVVGTLYINEKPVGELKQVEFTIDEGKANKVSIKPQRDSNGRFIGKNSTSTKPVKLPKRDSKGHFISSSKPQKARIPKKGDWMMATEADFPESVSGCCAVKVKSYNPKTQMLTFVGHERDEWHVSEYRFAKNQKKIQTGVTRLNKHPFDGDVKRDSKGRFLKKK